MDEKDFKKHLQDLVRGHHHPAEHDWPRDAESTEAATGEKHRPKTPKPSPRKKRAK